MIIRDVTASAYIRRLEDGLASLKPQYMADSVLIFRRDIERNALASTPPSRPPSFPGATPLRGDLPLPPVPQQLPTPEPIKALNPPLKGRLPWKFITLFAATAVFLGFLPDLAHWATRMGEVTSEPPSPPSAPLPATDPAAACWQNGAWQGGCGFAAYPGGPVFRVVGGDLSFTMGTAKGSDAMAGDDEDPPHPVRFQRRFALAETEVTVAQYLACVSAGKCDEPEWRQAGSPAYYRERNAHLAESPITGVSWHNAGQYVAWLNQQAGAAVYTLPTEAQWEYAARGGQQERWYFGSTESELKHHAWYGDNSGYKLHPVGTTPRRDHPWGLKDMAGNAWEWVADCWHDNYRQAPQTGDTPWQEAQGGNCGQRVVRGGSWNYVAWNSRAAYRFRDSTVYRLSYLSFRPARMLP